MAEPWPGLSFPVWNASANIFENRTSKTNRFPLGGTVMSTDKVYSHYCRKCNEETTHVPALSRSARIASRTWKIFIFFISGGFVYPHPLPSDEDPVAVTCSKCLTHSTIHG
jgi:hypothetical protein